jgi:hypothetical protein
MNIQKSARNHREIEMFIQAAAEGSRESLPPFAKIC